MTIKYILILGLLLASLPVMTTSRATGLTDDLSDCAAIFHDTERLRCYDRLANSPQLLVKEDGSSSVKKLVPDRSASSPDNAIAEKPSFTNTIRKTGVGRQLLGLRPYRRNYILPVTYNDRVNLRPFTEADVGFRPDDIEVKFQLSAELPLWKNILEQDLDLYFAYTQLSFFQAYNSEYSAPFRDTSYEPELGLNWHPDLAFMEWQLKSARIAINHQSNGRSEPLSRSWNRLVGQLQISRSNLGLGLRVWQRLPENAGEDDNPDISHFLGHGELSADYDLGRHHFGLMLRNPLKHAAVRLDWSYRLNERLSLYMQYFNGYGESLIDYDHSVNRIGLGFLLNEW